MRATHRVAVLTCVAVLASGAAPAAVATSHSAQPRRATGSHSAAAHRQVARLALLRLDAGGPVAGRRINPGALVTATVCFDGQCVHRRLRPDPTCDPSAGVCIGTALQAWRRNHYLVEVELA
jgi:hypothetical protein